MTWEVCEQSVMGDDDEIGHGILSSKLKRGWESFAVTTVEGNSETLTYHLRRQKSDKNQAARRSTENPAYGWINPKTLSDGWYLT